MMGRTAEGRLLRRLLAGIALAGLLSGCGSTGTMNAELATRPVPPNKARLTITRTEEMLAMAVPARIEINGKKVADIGNGASTIIDIAPGTSVISVSGWSYPGTFSVKLAAKPGQRYAVEVATRSASILPGVALGPVGGMIDASINENAGLFRLRLVDVNGAGL